MSGPRFIPKVDFERIEPKSERDVAEALRDTLDGDWLVFYSYRWLRKGHYLAEGETDFVLLHPRYGMLVLEVKGGQIRFDSDHGDWWQNGDPMDSPFEQAQGNLHALKDQITERAQFSKMPCPFGYAVTFPHCNFEGSLPPGAERSITFSSRDLPILGRRVREALLSWSRTNRPQEMHQSDFDQLKKALQSTFKLVPSLIRELNSDEQVLVQLTEDQAEGLVRIYSNPRVHVEGTAGSGKTMMALARARSFAEQGMQSLLLCYNRKLADWLRRITEGVEGLKVAHFHGLCWEFCQKAGLAFEPPPKGSDESGDFWRHKCAELLLDATDEVTDRFDAIVVDEGQDFHDEWWVGIEALQRNVGGPLYIFFDRAQNLYATGLSFPSGITYNLSENCRNTRSIAKSCGKVLGQSIKSPRNCPEGVAPVVKTYADEEEVREACTRLVQDVIGKEGLHPSRVALLSPHVREKSCLNIDRLGNYPLIDQVPAWMAGEGIWFSTIRAFKGLEAEVMVLVDIGDLREDKFSKEDLFVACSRARHRLYVFTNSQPIRQLVAS